MPRGYNSGLARWQANARRLRRVRAQRALRRLDLDSIPIGERAAALNGYTDYLAAAAAGRWHAPGSAEASALPSNVETGPAVDWSGYDLAADYA